MIAVLGYLADINEWVGQGWTVGRIMNHPVLRCYGRVYYWREL